MQDVAFLKSFGAGVTITEVFDMDRRFPRIDCGMFSIFSAFGMEDFLVGFIFISIWNSLNELKIKVIH